MNKKKQENKYAPFLFFFIRDDVFLPLLESYFLLILFWKKLVSTKCWVH